MRAAKPGQRHLKIDAAFKTIKPRRVSRSRRWYPRAARPLRGAGKYDRLITQTFFPNEALNEQDHFLQFVKDPYRDAVIATAAQSGSGSDAGALSYVWDIVLISG